MVYKMSDIKTGIEIYGDIKDINKEPAKSIKELSEKCFDKRILEKWVKVDDVLLNLRSWLQANDFSELNQCVSDYINELEE